MFDVDLNQLRSFVTVASFGHLTRAAEAVHLSQPALSGQIKALEEDLGLLLFDRTPTGMALTPAGKRLLVHAEKIINRVQELRHVARSLNDQLTGKLMLGTVLDPWFLRVGDLLARAFERHPEIELDLRHVLSHEALAGVRSGELDASFYFGTLPDDLTGVGLRAINYRVLMPGAWAATLAGASWESMAAYPWIITPEQSSHRHLVEELFRDRAEFPPRTIEADNESVITNLVESGVGISLVREEIALPSAKAGRSAIWPEATVRTDLWLIYAANRRTDPLLIALLDVLREVWTDELQAA